MSNHTGSHLLNEVFFIMEKYHILEGMKQPDRIAFISETTAMACEQYDCNAGEILDQIGEQYHICYYCLKEGSDFDEGICGKCRASF